jgi:hypothetical protein
MIKNFRIGVVASHNAETFVNDIGILNSYLNLNLDINYLEQIHSDECIDSEWLQY